MMSRLARGFAYTEALVATVILAIALVPASEAFRSAQQHGELSRQRLALTYRALAGMETVLAASFNALDAEAVKTGGTTASTVWSDPAGTADRRLVYVAPHDIDNADGDDNPLTGVEAGVVQVRLEVVGTTIAFQTLVPRP